MGETMNLDKDILESAKFSASKVGDKYLRKRAFALNLAANAAAKFLNEKGLKISVNHSLYKSPAFASEIELADIYCGEARFDVRVTFNDTTFCVPKSHTKYGVKPYAYIVAKLGSNLDKIDFIGFVPENELNYPKSDSEYFTFSTDILKSISDFTAYAKALKVPSHPYDEKEHENIKEICVNFIDNQANEADKIYFIKHVASCPVCRETFRDMNDFDDIVSQLKNYKELLNDSTLSVLSGNKTEVDQAVMENIALVENAQEDESEAPLVEPASIIGAAGAAISAGAVAGVAAGSAEAIVSETAAEIADSITEAASEVVDAAAAIAGETNAEAEEVVEDIVEELSEAPAEISPDAQGAVAESVSDSVEPDIDSLEPVTEEVLHDSEDTLLEDLSSDDFSLEMDSPDEFLEINPEESEIKAQEEAPAEEAFESEITEEQPQDEPQGLLQEDSLPVETADDDLMLPDSGEEELLLEEHEDSLLLEEAQEPEEPVSSPEEPEEEMPEVVTGMEEFVDEAEEAVTDIEEFAEESAEAGAELERLAAEEPETMAAESDDLELQESDIDKLEGISELEMLAEPDTELNFEPEADALEEQNSLEELNSSQDVLNETEAVSSLESSDTLELDDLDTLDSLEPVEELSYVQTPVELKYDDEDEEELIAEPVESFEQESNKEREDEPETVESAGATDDVESEFLAQEPEQIELAQWPQHEEQISQEPQQPESQQPEPISQAKEEEQAPEVNEDLQELLDDDLLALLSDDDDTTDSSSVEPGAVEQEAVSQTGIEEPVQETEEPAHEIPPEAEMLNPNLVNDDVENLYDGQEIPAGENVELDISREPVSEETIKKTKKLAVSAALIMLLAIGGGAGAWYIHHKNTVDKEAMDAASGDQMFDFSNKGENSDTDTAAAALPQDINKSMTNSFSDKPAAISITKLSWQISEKLAVEPSVKEYLQTAGKNIQMNLQNDLANAADIAFNNSVKVSFEIAPDNTMKGIQVLESSGSDKIDEIITKSIKNTLKYVSVPKLQNYKSDYFLTLIINF